MSNDGNHPVHMRRIDPTLNMRRFYSLALQPTLFGGASIIRNWGRIGTNGQSMMETFDRPEEAMNAMARLERTKRRRGYKDEQLPEDRGAPGWSTASGGRSPQRDQIRA